MEVKVRSATFWLEGKRGDSTELFIIDYTYNKQYDNYKISIKSSEGFHLTYTSERTLPSTDGAIKILQNALAGKIKETFERTE